MRRLLCFAVLSAACATSPASAPQPRPAAATGQAPTPDEVAASAKLHPPVLTGTASVTPEGDGCPRTTHRFAQPIAVTEDGGVRRRPGVVGFPIAFPRSADLRSITGFFATTTDGRRLPTQMEVLSRWGDGPNHCAAPIRWAYGWVAADVDPDSRAYLTLRHEPEALIAPGPGVRVDDDIDRLIVDTGPARFTVRKDWFNGLSKVELATGEGYTTVLSVPSDAQSGLLVERQGELASPIHGRVDSFEIERAGPVVVTAAIKGEYRTPAKTGPFRYAVRMHFHLGSTAATIDHTYYHGAFKSDHAEDGATNRALSDRVFMRLPLTLGEPSGAVARGAKTVHAVAAGAAVAVQQDKRSPERKAVVFAVRAGGEDLELGTYADRPFVAARGAAGWALATIPFMGPRDPQAIRYEPRLRALEVDWQSEALYVGGARGIWSKAVLEFGLDGGADLAAVGTQAYLHGSRPLIGAPNPTYLNTTGAWTPLPTGELPSRYRWFDQSVDVMHDRTADYLRRYRITGTQIWPDMPRHNCQIDGSCRRLEDSYFEGGDNNYWDWSTADMEQFLRTADPSFLHDFSLAEAITMAETISWRPDPKDAARLVFAGYSPCYGGGSGWRGPWMEGLNQRRDRCAGGYSYNKVHKLAYVLTADRRFTDFFEQGADSTARRYLEVPSTKPSDWQELGPHRSAAQYLELLLDGAEFGRIGGDARARMFRDRAVTYFDFLTRTTMERGHVCHVLGSGLADPKLKGECRSIQGWMMPPLVDWVLRLYRFTGHAPAKQWLLDFGTMAARQFAEVDSAGRVDFAPLSWRTVYKCAASAEGIDDDTCEKQSQMENEGRFYSSGMVAFLNSFALILAADGADPLGICRWLPDAYATSLRAMSEYNTNNFVWGKVPGQAYAFTTAALGALARCEAK